jgi:hypothetical protein
LGSRGLGDEVTIATKVGGRPPQPAKRLSEHVEGLSTKLFRESAARSLENLGRDRIDVYYAHAPDLAVPLEEQVEAVGTLAADGAVGLVGISENTIDLSEFEEDASVTRRVLDALSVRQDGKAAAASTIARRRATFHGAMQYGVELKVFAANPIDIISWTSPKHDDEVDRRVVVNPSQVRLLRSRAGDLSVAGGVLRVHVFRRAPAR